jgi:hypothetical protein
VPASSSKASTRRVGVSIKKRVSPSVDQARPLETVTPVTSELNRTIRFVRPQRSGAGARCPERHRATDETTGRIGLAVVHPEVRSAIGERRQQR